MKAKQIIEEKALREEQQRIEHEAMIARMEQEELELLKRLQNTQLLQKAAYEDLESALQGEGRGSEIQSDARPGTGVKKGNASVKSGGGSNNMNKAGRK
jgi:hypothetical protein